MCSKVDERGIFSVVSEIGGGLVGTSDMGEARSPIRTWGIICPPSIGHILAAAVHIPAQRE